MAPTAQIDTSLVYTLPGGRKVPAVPQPDGTVLVRDLPLFSVVYPDDPGVKEGTRAPRDRAWLEEAKRRHEVYVRELGFSPLLTQRHIFDGPRAVGTYRLGDIRPVQVNPDEPPRDTIFHDQVFASREDFEASKDYPFRSPEISPDDPKGFGAVALLRDKQPYGKYPNTKPELVEAYYARGGVPVAQLWAREVETFASAVSAGALSYEQKEASHMAAPAAPAEKEPSMDERMEAMVAKCFGAFESKMKGMFEGMLKGKSEDEDKEGEASEAADDETKDGSETMESEPEDKGEKKPKTETAAARGPDANLPPAVNGARAGETFQSGMSKAERDELVALRNWVNKRKAQEDAETFAAKGCADLRAGGVDVDESFMAELKTEAFESGERGVKARVSAILNHQKRLASTRSVETFQTYGVGLPSSGDEDPELKRAYEQFGQRPEARLAIQHAYREYHQGGNTRTPFSLLCAYDDRINPASRGAARGGVDRTGGR